MHVIDCFEGVDGGRGLAWRCADSLALRDLLRPSNREKAFGWVLQFVAERGLTKGERIGSTARRWRPTRRCARPRGATTASAIARR
jgi:hypothetical protein